MMLRGNPISRDPAKGESIEVCARGGSSCSSDENSVMELERRGCVSPKKNAPNHKR
jgi:hypothetical protein